MGKEKSRGSPFTHDCSSHTTDIDLQPASFAHGQPAQPGDGKVTSKEIYLGIGGPALIRKIDIRVIPVLSLLFLFSFLDQINIANAAVYGMCDELELAGNQYNVALAIFFPPFVLFEIPGNLLLKRFHPHVWLPACMFVVGCVTIVQGFVKSYSGLLATRFFLGLAEASIYPGCLYLIAMWYRSSGEALKRFTFFFCSTNLGGAFGGLLAYAIFKLDGTAGLSSWRWVFIIEGLMTVGCAVIVFFLIADFPEKAKWLSDDEKAFIKAKFAEDIHESQLDAKPTWKDVLGVLKDPKILLAGLVHFGNVVSGYTYPHFAPAIIQSLNYHPADTQLYSVPPWAATFALSMIVATASDYYRRRYIFILPMSIISVIGIIVLLNVHNDVNVRYGALILSVMGIHTAIPITVCWFNASLNGHLKRIVGTAFQLNFGNCGGIIATFSFLARDAPNYVMGYSISLGFIGLSAVSCTLYFFTLMSENRKRAGGLSEHSDKSEEKQARLGYSNPEYRHVV